MQMKCGWCLWTAEAIASVIVMRKISQSACASTKRSCACGMRQKSIQTARGVAMAYTVCVSVPGKKSCSRRWYLSSYARNVSRLRAHAMYGACHARSRSAFAVVRTHGALFLDLPVALLHGVAFVVFLLAPSQADFHLHAVAFPVHGGGHQGVALALDGAKQAVGLATVQQQLAGTPILGNHVRGGAGKRWDRGADQEQLAVLCQGIAVAEVDAPAAQRLQLPALQGNAGFIALVDVVVEAGALVQRYGARAFGTLVLVLVHVR